MQSREIVWRETSTRVHRMNPDNEVLLSTPPSQRISGVLKENTLCLSLDWDVWGRCVCKLGWWKEGVVAEETMDITCLYWGEWWWRRGKKRGEAKRSQEGGEKEQPIKFALSTVILVDFRWSHSENIQAFLPFQRHFSRLFVLRPEMGSNSSFVFAVWNCSMMSCVCVCECGGVGWLFINNYYHILILNTQARCGKQSDNPLCYVDMFWYCYDDQGIRGSRFAITSCLLDCIQYCHHIYFQASDNPKWMVLITRRMMMNFHHFPLLKRIPRTLPKERRRKDPSARPLPRSLKRIAPPLQIPTIS